MNEQRDTDSETGGSEADAPSHENQLDHEAAPVNEPRPDASGIETQGELEPRRHFPLAASSSGAMAGVAPRYAIDTGALPPVPVFAGPYETPGAANDVAIVAAELSGVLRETTRATSSVYSTLMVAMTDSTLTFHETFVNAFRTHLHESFDFLQQLVSARDPADAFAIQARYWERQVALMNGQAAEVRKAGERAFEGASRPFADELQRVTQRYRIC
jgi:hypothetical protein